MSQKAARRLIALTLTIVALSVAPLMEERHHDHGQDAGQADEGGGGERHEPDLVLLGVVIPMDESVLKCLEHLDGPSLVVDWPRAHWRILPAECAL